MKRALVCLVLVVATACRAAGSSSAGPLLRHDVYFTLREDTPEARAALCEACRRLGSLDGVLELSVGPRVEELDRPVNDQSFDLALHVLFRDRTAHDRYQVAPEHQALLAEWSPRFEAVRVFDSWTR